MTPNVGLEAGCQEIGEAAGTTYRRSVPVLSSKELRLFTQPQVHTASSSHCKSETRLVVLCVFLDHLE